MTDFPPFRGVEHALTDLLPTQQSDLARLKDVVSASPLVAFTGDSGMGRTTLLQHLSRDCGGYVVGSERIFRILADSPIEREYETFAQLVMDAMRRYPLVIFDDFGDVLNLGRQQGRGGLLRSILRQAWFESAVREGRKLILAGNLIDTPSAIFGNAPAFFSTSPLGEEDYRQILSTIIGPAAAGVDFNLVYRNAPMLDLYQLEYLGRLLKAREIIDAKLILQVLEQDVLKTNLDIQEVEQLNFDSLPGTEQIAEKLESYVIQPFLNKELARELDLKPCRGVLLYGPPGTGKTTIGRVLAHRMQGRFFLIDGSFVTEPPRAFFGAVAGIVRAAKAASPSVIFIDDADVLFQIEHIAGLSRYLLSLLDGVESETANHVCVVMTAMDAHKIPEALLRSGRVELWLETKAPDETTRAQMIARWMRGAKAGFEQIDCQRVARATQSFTPADLRRLAGEARLFYAGDVARGRPLESPDAYVDRAIAAILAQREEMTRQLGDESVRGRAYA